MAGNGPAGEGEGAEPLEPAAAVMVDVAGSGNDFLYGKTNAHFGLARSVRRIRQVRQEGTQSVTKKCAWARAPREAAPNS